jgi:hypothetical protein
LQKEEKLIHLFFKSPFAKNCWSIIGVPVPTWLKPDRATRYLRRKIRKSFAMEILMCCCILLERNYWIFKNEDPSVERCKILFKEGFALVIHTAKATLKPVMESWL